MRFVQRVRIPVLIGIGSVVLVATIAHLSAAQPRASTTRPRQATASRPVLQLPVRINAGADNAIVDGSGVSWLADQGFEGGDTVDRGPVAIANTKVPDVYRTERYNMDSYNLDLPNGVFTVKLHFCETFSNVTGPGQRLFDLDVQGHEIKDFDIFREAGGSARALVKTFDNVRVTNGRLTIVFVPRLQLPEINAIEVLPAAP